MADRLAVSAATEAKSYAVKTKADIVAGVQALEINKAGLEAPVGPAYVAVLNADQLTQLMQQVANIAEAPGDHQRPHPAAFRLGHRRLVQGRPGAADDRRAGEAARRPAAPGRPEPHRRPCARRWTPR